MSATVRRLAPIFLVEFFLVPISWALFDAASTAVLSYIPMFISLSVLPFLAGYVVARASHTFRLRHCAIAGASVSLVSIVSVALWSPIIWSQTEEFLLGIAGYILSTLLLAVVPQLLFGSLGGWVGRKGRHAISGT